MRKLIRILLPRAAIMALFGAITLAIAGCGPEIRTRTPDPWKAWDGHPSPRQGYQEDR